MDNLTFVPLRMFLCLFGRAEPGGWGWYFKDFHRDNRPSYSGQL